MPELWMVSKTGEESEMKWIVIDWGGVEHKVEAQEYEVDCGCLNLFDTRGDPQDPEIVGVEAYASGFWNKVKAAPQY